MTGSWVYLRSEPTLWTVGFYRPDGRWEPESDHGSKAEAAERVRWLNGGASSGAGADGESLPAPRPAPRRFAGGEQA